MDKNTKNNRSRPVYPPEEAPTENCGRTSEQQMLMQHKRSEPDDRHANSLRRRSWCFITIAALEVGAIAALYIWHKTLK